MDQLSVFKSSTKAQFRNTRVQDIIPTISKAFYIAQSNTPELNDDFSAAPVSKFFLPLFLGFFIIYYRDVENRDFSVA